MNKSCILLVMVIFIIACKHKTPVTGKLNKDHSIEVTYETKDLNASSVLLIRHENVYIHGEKVISFSRSDTLPAPGDTVSMENINGKKDSLVHIHKLYEFFVTVK